MRGSQGETSKLQDSEKCAFPTDRNADGIQPAQSPARTAEQESDPTRGLTYEELGRNNGNKKGGRRRTGGLL